MGVPQWVSERYTAQLPYLEAVEAYVRSVLAPYCERNGYPFRARLKDVESVSEKLETGRFGGWDELDDLVAATIVVPNLTYEDRVARHLESVFSAIEVRTRFSAETPPESFRYNSTRWIGQVRDDPPPDLPEEALKIPFEIQIQTALENAWLTATHDKTYKGGGATWQQLRLAASVKATVEQLDLMIADFFEAAEAIKASPHPETDTKTYVVEIFQGLLEEGLLDRSLEPQSWSRFADNVWALVRRWKGGSATATEVRTLVDGMADASRRSEFQPALSGSLFQAILAFAATTTPAMIKKTCIVPSSELFEIYGLDSIPREIASPTTRDSAAGLDQVDGEA